MTAPAGREAFLEALAGQRALYASALPAKVDEIERLWQEIAAGTAGPGALDRLERLVHGLAGSGAVFGFDDVSSEARAVERTLHGIGPALQHLRSLAGGV